MAARRMPRNAAAQRAQRAQDTLPVDMEGMDSEMAGTLTNEKRRRVAFKIMGDAMNETNEPIEERVKKRKIKNARLRVEKIRRDRGY